MPRGFQKGNKIMLGRKLPREWRLNISRGSLGKKMSKKTREKMRKAQLGKKMTKDVKQKISLTKKGIPLSDKNKLGISIALRGKKKSREHVEKVSQSLKKYYKLHSNLLKNKNNPNWKGGITPINFKIRNSNKYKLWREKVFKRDNYICKICNKKGGRLEADHIKQFSKYPKLRFRLSNGRTLCKECHKKITYGNL